MQLHADDVLIAAHAIHATSSVATMKRTEQILSGEKLERRVTIGYSILNDPFSDSTSHESLNTPVSIAINR